MSENDERSWSTTQVRVQEWLALPKYERFPPTQDLLAEDLGIADKTITRWKKLPGFMDDVRSIALRYLRDDLPEVFGAIGREASKGNHQMARLALELVGGLPTQGTTPSNLSVRVEYVNDWRGDP